MHDLVAQRIKTSQKEAKGSLVRYRWDFIYRELQAPITDDDDLLFAQQSETLPICNMHISDQQSPSFLRTHSNLI